MNGLMIVVVFTIVGILFFIAYNANNEQPEQPEILRPYVYADFSSSSNATAIAIGMDAVSSSEKEATVYGKWIAKNASVIAYLNGNKLMVKEIRSDEK